MPIVRTVHIFCEKGLEVLLPHTEKAIKDVLECFPQYKDNYAVNSVGAWRNKNCQITQSDGRKGLKEYESVDWYISHAGYRSTQEGRWKLGHQLSAEQLWEDLTENPYFKDTPQYFFLLLKHDMYFGENNFCLGVTKPDAFSIVSTSSILSDKSLNIEEFKTLVMHEFGHLINLTPDNRPNTKKDVRTECRNVGCLMCRCTDSNIGSMTQIRKDRMRYNFSLLCEDCLKAGERFFNRQLAEARKEAK